MVSRRIQTIWNRDKLLHANQHDFRWQRGTHTVVVHLLNQLEWFLKLDAIGNIYIRAPEFKSKKKMTKASDHLRNELPMLDMKNSNCFHPERGVGQGDTPSSLIFIAVFDILLTLLDESGTGQPHASADDLAHIALTQEDQQRHASSLSILCHHWS